MTAVTRVATAVSSLSGSWTSATAAQLNSDNAAYATITGATKNTTIGELALSGFDFDSQIPSGATIDSVELIVDWKVSTTSSVAILGTAYEVSAAAGTYQENSAEPTTDTTNTYDVTALRTWTRANLLDGTFRMLLRARQGNSTTSVVYSFDYAAVRVNYTAAAPPDAAATATPTRIGGNVLRANWTAPGSGPAPTGYKLTVATDSGFTSIVSGYNALDVGNVLFKLVTGLSASTTYYYKVVAYNAVGDGADSDTRTTGTVAAAAFRDTVLNMASMVAYFREGDAAVGTMKDEAEGPDGSYGTGTLVNQTGILASETGAKSVYYDDNLAHFGTVAHRSNLALTYPFSILVITKPDRANGSSGTYDRILAKPNTMGSNSAPWNDYGIGAYGGASKFFFSYSLSGSENVLTADNDIVQGTTYMVSVTAASGAQKLYINKTLQAATGASTTNPGTSGQPLRIGQRNDLDNKYKGNVEEVIIFNAALTQTEIDALYDATQVSAVSGAAALVASPTLSAAGTVPAAGSAALTATPTLTAAGSVPLNALPGAPLYFGAGAFGVYGVQTSGAAASSAALVASPTLIAAGTLTQFGAAALTASPTLLAAGRAVYSGAAALTATPTLAVAGAVAQLGAAALVATPTLAAAATQAVTGAAALVASPTLAAAGTAPAAGAAALVATPTLVAAGLAGKVGAAALTATPTLIAAGTATYATTAALVATPTLTAAGLPTQLGAAALTATPTLVAAGTVTALGAAALVASPTLIAAGAVKAFGAAALTATPTLLAAGTAGIQSGAQLTATPTLAAAGAVAYTGAAALTATPTLAAAGLVTQTAAAALAASPALVAAGSVTALGAAALSASPSLLAAGTVTGAAVSGAAALNATPVLSAAAVLDYFGVAALDASGTLTAAGTVIQLGAAMLDASPNLSAAGIAEGFNLPGSVNGYTVLVYGDLPSSTAEVGGVRGTLVGIGSVDGGTA